MALYLLHFSPSYKHAKHYLGYADDVAPRVYAHLHGRGARLTQVAHQAGCEIVLVRVWDEGTRRDERKLKNNSHSPRLCPICQGLGVQLPLLLGEPAYVPIVAPAVPPLVGEAAARGEAPEAAIEGTTTTTLPLPSGTTLFEWAYYEAELEDSQEWRADEAYHASGNW